MLLKATTESIVGDLAGAASPAPMCFVTYSDFDLNGKLKSRGSKYTAFDGATDVTLVASPGEDVERRIDSINIHNADNAAITASVWFDDGTNEPILFKGTLEEAESVTYTPGSGWLARTSSGGAKSTAALAGGSLARGLLLAGDANGVAAAGLDMGASAGKIIVDDGTDPAVVAMSGEATMTGAGVVSVARAIREVSVIIAAADVKTLDATPVALVDHSAMVSAGICSSGDALIFHGAVMNIHDGGTDYDQDCDLTAQYNTGPVTLSLTDDDFLNDGTDGSIGTLKPLATDLAYNQVLIDEDIELKASASPFNAAGDRLLKVTTYFSVFTPA